MARGSAARQRVRECEGEECDEKQEGFNGGWLCGGGIRREWE